MDSKDKFNELLEKSIKPNVCICGKHYNSDLGVSGTFIGNANHLVWCCCSRCGKDYFKECV